MFVQNDGSCCSMLRYGEYSPNNPQYKVVTAPYIGLGEYEQRRQFFSKQRKADYLQHLSKVFIYVECYCIAPMYPVLEKRTSRKYS